MHSVMMSLMAFIDTDWIFTSNNPLLFYLNLSIGIKNVAFHIHIHLHDSFYRFVSDAFNVVFDFWLH